MEDVLGYAGSKVVVTGAASGMGAATAQILVDVGADVIGVDIKPTEVPVAQSLLVDLKDKAAIDAAVAAIDSTIGRPVRAVFSCAGLPGPPFSELDVMLVNFVGGRYLIESLIPKMPEGSAIAYIASNAGLGWQQELPSLMELVQTDGFDAGKKWCEEHADAYAASAYMFSKKVINAWVAWRAAALITQGIRLNCINPGPTSTPMMPFFEEANGKELVHAFVGPIGRDSEAVEQAWPMVFLNSPRMSYVNGEALHTDGGFLGAMVTGQIDFAALLPPAECARVPIDKIVGSFDEAVADVRDDSVVHIGGFGGPAEYPSYLIAALARKGVTGLTITGNHSGFSMEQLAMMREHMASLLGWPDDYFGPGLLVERGQVAKGILAFPVLPGGALKVPFEGLLQEGKVELELIGQGSLAERIRAARAGIAAFYTPVGAGTVVAEGKDVRWFDGRPHILERALKADLSIIRAHKADRWGNLVYRGTARTFNATMAGAAHVTIAEVDEIVELGDLDPECIVTPAPYVQRVVKRPRPAVDSWETPC